MFHHFEHPVDGIPLPEKFTYPFCYVPHPLCRIAKDEVCGYLSGESELYADAMRGKMFGVLVVKRPEDGCIGFLAAYSGILSGRNDIPYFVPPVYDLLSPDGFFKREEAEISVLNRSIESILHSDEYNIAREQVSNAENESSAILAEFRQRMKEAKAKRDHLRATGISSDMERDLIRESQYMKAEYKRLEKRMKEHVAEAAVRLRQIEERINSMKQERKRHSADLQSRLFSQFVMLDAEGHSRNLCDIFRDTGISVPPSGAGECAAPKLLQYAYLNHLQPIAMAEFWQGESPRTEIRHHDCFYPSCRSKCEPILGFMLGGLDVEDNPVQIEAGREYHPTVLYEDSCIAVVDKPAGMLSVPGKAVADSVYDFAVRRYPSLTGPGIVHRLDMATSGLLVVALDKDTHASLQRQFLNHSVVKRYYAILEGVVPNDSGTIELPMRPDINDRPRQVIDSQYGRPAVTRYDVCWRRGTETGILFTPLTGRTHQLRVHSASGLGLNAPIKGDAIYGTKGDRLCLHAGYIEFTHPHTGERISFESVPDFWNQ